ncbi:hypothetical protein ACI79G_12280 [Geodermatophilus sp. SYSU D00779]
MLRAVSWWATPELAIASDLTQQGAGRELERSLTLVHRLPAPASCSNSTSVPTPRSVARR